MGPSLPNLVICMHRLADLKEGHCSYGFFYNQSACCSGLDLGGGSSTDPVLSSVIGKCLAGELCVEWHSWSQTLRIRSLLGQSLLHSFVYVVLSVGSLHLYYMLDHNCRGIGHFCRQRSCACENICTLVRFSRVFNK